MGLLDKINVDRHYVDINIWIDAFEWFSDYIAELAALFAAVDRGEFVIILSELTLAEALVKQFQSGNIQQQSIY